MHSKVFFAVSVSLSFACCLGGATHTWTGTVSSLWSDNANWTGGTPAGDPAADLVFPTSTRLVSTNDIPGVSYVNTIQFTDSGYTINSLVGSSIALAGSIQNSFSGTNTLELPIALYGGANHLLYDPGCSVAPCPNSTLMISGAISGGVSDGLSIGSGSDVTFSGNNTYAGITHVASAVGHQGGGHLTVLGFQPNSGVNVVSPRGLSGTGTVGPLNVEGTFPGVARVSPGTAVPGILTVSGNASFQTDGTLRVRLNGTTPGSQYDRLDVQGSVQLSPFPQLSIVLGYQPQVGDTFTILQASGAVTGYFANPGPDGSIFSVDCLNFQIHYTSNSVVVTRVAGGGPALDGVEISTFGSRTVCTNSTGGTVTVMDTGGCNNAHQWGYRVVSGGAITPIAGETGTDYVIDGNDFPGQGTYYLVETTTPEFGSAITSNELTITVVPAPTAAASGSATICLGGSTALSGSGAAMCSWTPSTGLSDPSSCNPVASPATTTTYFLTVTGPTGCTSTNSAQVTVTVDPTCSAPLAYYTLSPCRVVDTRGAVGSFGGPPLTAGDERIFPIAGQCGVPGSAKAVALNVTVTQPTLSGYLTVHPAGTPLPLASTINYSPDQTRANNAVALLGDGGIAVVAKGAPGATGTVHVIVDVNGYFQ